MVTNRMREMRIKRGFSQREFAGVLGTSQPFISKLEREDYNPSVRELRKVAVALGVKATELI